MTTSSNRCSSDKQDIAQMKGELSLDLQCGSKMSVDGDASMCSSNNKHILNIPSTPNTPNFTHTSADNTSQSVTPSEFGYHHLNRQSAAVSSDSSPKSTETNIYENLVQSFSSYENTTGDLRRNTSGSNITLLSISSNTPKALSDKSSSPIRSTINITYNIRSPSLKGSNEKTFTFASNKSSPQTDYENVNLFSGTVMSTTEFKPKQPLLETTFDENMVYEQVKFYKGSITEVNQLLENGNKCIEAPEETVCEMADDVRMEERHSNEMELQVVPNLIEHPSDRAEVNSNELMAKPINNMLDEIEEDTHRLHGMSMYENVELRKPERVYENMKVSQQRKSPKENVDPSSDVQKPNNFLVKKLANRFETSPEDTMPPFDFSKPYFRKLDNNKNSTCFVKKPTPVMTPVKTNKQQLHKSANMTRSLDENAFVREFGNTPLKLENINRSIKQISVAAAAADAMDNRRMSLELTPPKSLNPPKRLPNLEDTEPGICSKSELSSSTSAMVTPCQSTKLRLDISKTASGEHLGSSSTSLLSNYECKITPTTENPISLIQHNVNIDVDGKQSQDDALQDVNNQPSNLVPSLKVLGNCKLDRERIDRIKEERRHQLNEKYRTESFRTSIGGTAADDYNTNIRTKSKSKIELRDLRDSIDDNITVNKSDLMSYKSKSRTDVSSVSRNSGGGGDYQQDIAMQFGLGGAVGSTGRIRRISDEKNQNDCIDYLTEDAKMTDFSRNSFSGGGATTKTRSKFDKKEIDFMGTRDRDKFSANIGGGGIGITTARSSLGSQ